MSKPLPKRLILDSLLDPLIKLELAGELQDLIEEIAGNDTDPLAKLDLAERIQVIQDQLLEEENVAEHKPPKGEFGLKEGAGDTAREQLNNRAKSILARYESGDDLSEDDIAVIRQYSGRGGLKEGSQFEYYTPNHIAEGIYDILGEFGVISGNVLEPSAGAGVFSAVKPKGMVVSGVEIDKTSATINQILHPEDQILNQSFEELVTSDAETYYDAVVGNIPFGDQRGSYRHKDPAYKSERRIDRYFIHRSIDKVRNGGLICMVVPTNIIGDRNKAWVKFRSDISKKAEFLGAHKLPSGTFGKQGTETVTDIIVLKKHPAGLIDKMSELPTETLEDSNVLWSEFIQGKYWIGEGKKYIKGKYIPRDKKDRWSRDQVIPDGNLTDKDLQRQLAVKFESRIDWEALGEIEPTPKQYSEGDTKIINGSQYELKGGVWTKIAIDDASLTLDPKTYGANSLNELASKLDSISGAMELGFSVVNEVVIALGKDFLPDSALDAYLFSKQQDDGLKEHAFRGALIGSKVNQLQNFTASWADNPDVEPLRDKLASLVTGEFNKYGHSSKLNKGIIRSGVGSRDYGAFDAAIGKNGRLSDLLRGELDTEEAEGYDSGDISSIISSFYNSEMEPVTLEDLKKVYTGSLSINTLSDLASVDDVAIDPSGVIYPLDVYCSGEFMPKLHAMNQALATEKDSRLIEKFNNQIARIESKRIRTPTADIVFGLRQSWIEPKYIEEFLEGIGYTHIMWDDDNWEHPYNQKPRSTELRLLRYLQGEKITGDSDYEATEYREKIKVLEEQFNNFLKTHPDSVELTERFNAVMNSYIPFEYSKDSLNLKGKAPNIEPHAYQNQAIRQLSDKGRGILGDGVGLGKTLQALALHQYDIEKGRGKRTCIVVPVSVLQNWYNEAKNFLLTMDDTLFVGFDPKRDKEGLILQEHVLDENAEPKINKYTGKPVMQDVLKKDSSDTIKEKLRSIPQSNYQLVIMPSTRFEELPLRDETVSKYMGDWVSRGMMNEKKTEGHAADKKRNSLKDRHSDQGKEKDNALPYFEDMLFDKVIVDEGHFFKNSYKPGSEATRIANIPGTNPSKRASDMAMKMGFVRDANNGHGTFMLTATPFTNSPVEIFNMMAMTMPMEEFERMGVYSTDDFISQFGKTEIKPRVTMAGDITESEMLTGFNNLQGLRGMFYRYAVVRDADMVKEDMQVPPHETIRAETELSELQESIYEELRAEAQGEVERMLAAEEVEALEAEGEVDPETGIITKIGLEEEEKPRRHMFSILRDMERVSTDIDLYNREITFLFSKSDLAKVKGIPELLPGSKSVKEDNPEGGKENVEVDLDFTLTEEGSTVKLVVPSYYEDDVIKAIKKQKIGIETVSHPMTPKYAKLIDNLKSELDAGGKQIIFTEEKTQHKKLARMIAHHLSLKPAQIGIINADEANGEKLQEIADKYNSGAQVVVIANRKAEVGVNLQKGTTAIHHLTFPWTPASLEQRNGRGVRQGNTAAHINIYYYISKRSVDTLRLDRISGKENWIAKMVHGSESDLEYKDENTLSNDDYLYLFAKDPEEAKARLKIEERKAEAQRQKKQDKNMLIALAQYAEADAFISGFESAVNNEKSNLTEKIQTAERDLAQAKMRFGEKNRQTIDIEKSLQRLKYDSSLVDARMNRMLGQAQNVHKQQKAYLSGQKKLPFSKELLSSPANALVNQNAEILEAGHTYDIPASEVIFRVDEIDFSGKKAVLSVLLSKDDRPFGYGVRANSKGHFTISILKLSGFKPVSYSAYELDVKRLEASENLDAKRISELDDDLFKEKSELIKTKLAYGEYYIATDPSGDYQPVQTSYDSEKLLPDGFDLVMPDKNNQTMKEQLAKLYLAENRSGYVYWDSKIMPLLFGDSWKEAIEEYRNNGVKTEVLDAMDKLYNARSAEVEDALEKILTVGTTYSYGVFLKRGVVTEVAKANNWDNDDEIKKWCDDYLQAKYSAYKEEQVRLEEENRKAEELDLQTVKLAIARQKYARQFFNHYSDEQEVQVRLKTSEEVTLTREQVLSDDDLFEVTVYGDSSDSDKDIFIRWRDVQDVLNAQIWSDTNDDKPVAAPAEHKSIPQSARDQLAEIGVSIHYISHPARLTVKGKTKTVKAYSDILLQDKKPFGHLYKNKEKLKSKFDAFFCEDINDNAKGKWWVVTGDEDPAEVAEALMPSERELKAIKAASMNNASAPKKLIVPTTMGVGDTIDGHGWVIVGVSPNGAWEANERSIEMDQSQKVTFDIEEGEDVYYAYFN